MFDELIKNNPQLPRYMLRLFAVQLAQRKENEVDAAALTNGFITAVEGNYYLTDCGCYFVGYNILGTCSDAADMSHIYDLVTDDEIKVLRCLLDNRRDKMYNSCYMYQALYDKLHIDINIICTAVLKFRACRYIVGFDDINAYGTIDALNFLKYCDNRKNK